jgi:hypothetical protein
LFIKEDSTLRIALLEQLMELMPSHASDDTTPEASFLMMDVFRDSVATSFSLS